MKKIKFRAWDKELNKFHYFNGIFNNKPYTETSSFPQYESIPRYHELIISQFTGLYDSNGKEIYEGDIMTSERYPFQDDGKYNYHAVVEWFDNSAQFGYVRILVDSSKAGISNGIGDAFEDDESIFEIIGNIYENMDLLEGNY